MSNKTQLATNNTQLASLIQTLQGKAAGGGGAAVETCTVVTNVTNGSAYTSIMWYFTIVENGNVTYGNVYDTGEQTHVVCGTPVIAIIQDEYEMGGIQAMISSVEITAGYHDSMAIKNDAAVFLLDGVEAGETVTITLTVE